MNNYENAADIYDIICFAFCTEDQCKNCENGGCTCDVWFNFANTAITDPFSTIANEVDDGRKNQLGFDCHRIWKNDADIKNFIIKHYAELDKFLEEYASNNGPVRGVEERDPWLQKQQETLNKLKEYVEKELNMLQ